MELNHKRESLLEMVKLLHGEDRKYNGGPYWEHTLRVANMVDEKEKNYPLIWEVGLCHDLVEDHKCTSDGLFVRLTHCGYSPTSARVITLGVEELTNRYTSEDFPNLKREERKRMEASRLHKVSYEAASVNYADIIDNLPSIVKNDPEFGLTYWQEKMNIIEGMRHGNFDLLVKCCAVLEQCKIILKDYKAVLK